jgi:hypothetical protein
MPPQWSVNKTPGFSFTSKTWDATFECSLDGAAYSACGSPITVGPLALGRHSFVVRAVAPNGRRDPTPARWEWNLVTDVAAPVIQVQGLPAPGQQVPISFFKDLRGTATAGSGVARVQVALRVWGVRRQDTLYGPTYCLFANLHNGKRVVSPCLRPVYITPRGRVHWSLRVSRRALARLPHATYELQVRAINRAGEAAILKRKLDIAL